MMGDDEGDGGEQKRASLARRRARRRPARAICAHVCDEAECDGDDDYENGDGDAGNGDGAVSDDGDDKSNGDDEPKRIS